MDHANVKITAVNKEEDFANKQLSSGDIRKGALNLPNILTMLRVVAIPFVILLLVKDTAKANFWAANVYIVLTITDALDGWLARRQNLISVLGKFLDPLADKLLVMTTLIFLVDMGRVPAWAVALILARELSITGLRTIAMSEGIVIQAGRGGKDKTAFQMVAILLLILHEEMNMNFFFTRMPADFNQAGLGVLYLSIFFALTSAFEYIYNFSKAVVAKYENQNSQA